jgi:hypothetical protein
MLSRLLRAHFDRRFANTQAPEREKELFEEIVENLAILVGENGFPLTDGQPARQSTWMQWVLHYPINLPHIRDQRLLHHPPRSDVRERMSVTLLASKVA